MRVLCVGEMMVDLLVHPVGPVAFDNDASQVDEIAVKSGGDANNNAIDMAKLVDEEEEEQCGFDGFEGTVVHGEVLPF